MKAQETLDYELHALTALVENDTARLNADIKLFGGPTADYTTAARELERLLIERGVLGRAASSEPSAAPEQEK